jgi:hypothetical protein
MRHIFLLLIYLLSLEANDRFIIDFSKNDELNLSQKMVYFDETDNLTTAFDILNSKETKRVVSPNLGLIFDKPIWTKVQIQNPKSEQISIYLINPLPLSESIKTYIYKNKELLYEYSSGLLEKIDDYNKWCRFTNIKLVLEPNSLYEIVTKVDNNKNSTQIEWIAMSEEGFNKFLFLDYFIWGVILGGMFLLLILHILFFFTIKNKSFISYIFYIFIVLLYFFVNNGYANLLFGNGIFSLILSHLSAYSIFLVYMTFLDEYMKFRQKRIYSYILKPMYVYYIFIAFSSWVIIFSPAIYKYDSIYFILTFVSMVTLIILTSIEIYKTKSIQTFYILLGQISIFVAYILIFLTAFQKIPVTTDTQRVMGSFLFLEMILFTFAIFIRLKNIVEMKQKGEKLILSQSHFSSIGQMLKNIAHQWKVPAVRLGTLITEIESILFNNKIFDQKINNIIKSMRNNIDFMESTIVEFTQFYSKDEKRTIFNPIEEIFNIKTMLTEKINLQNLEINYNTDLVNLQLNGNPKSFAHIVLILIENILDISKRDNISTPTLSIFYEEKSQHTFIHFQDNCGGIKQKPIESIFELEASSYQDKNRGIGLSIAKILVEEKLHGKLSVLNVENGARFTLQIEKLSK